VSGRRTLADLERGEYVSGQLWLPLGARPRVLDLFCGGGGCSKGYERAGFDPHGVDKHLMPAYPFLSIEQADWRAVLADHEFVRTFDLVHASPVCKGYTSLRALSAAVHPLEIPEVRAALEATGLPYVIENVVGARRDMRDPVLLCGSMFGLGLGDAVLRRHRLFESNVPLSAPGPCTCSDRPVVGVYGTGGGWTRTAPGGGGTKVSGPDAAAAMGVDWTADQRVLSQMIPPSYCEHVGRQVIDALGWHADEPRTRAGVRGS
jgi:DNA (cytosine-5)-methyltransferase 1